MNASAARSCITALALLFFLAAPSRALAVNLKDIPGNIHVGPLEVHPSVTVKEAYTDNIFWESSGESGSAITTFSPGLILRLPLRRHFLELKYHTDIIEAARFHRIYDTDSHFVDLLVALEFNRLEFLFGDRWASDSTEPDFENDIRNNYYQNQAFFETTYQLPGRYKVKGFYTNQYRDFDSFRRPGQFDPELDDYMENDVGFDIFYRFLPATSALFEYGFTHRNNTDKGFPTTDSDAHRFWLGLSWEATAKIEGAIKGGYVKRDYDGGPSDDWSGFGMEADVKYTFRPYYLVHFQGFRQPKETSVTAEEGVYGTDSISSGGMISLRHEFTYKISAFIDALYYNDHYRESGLIGRKRDDDRFGFGLGLKYQVQDWLGCELAYHYLDNDSNISKEDYQENLIEGSVSLNF